MYIISRLYKTLLFVFFQHSSSYFRKLLINFKMFIRKTSVTRTIRYNINANFCKWSNHSKHDKSPYLNNWKHPVCTDVCVHFLKSKCVVLFLFVVFSYFQHIWIFLTEQQERMNSRTGRDDGTRVSFPSVLPGVKLTQCHTQTAGRCLSAIRSRWCRSRHPDVTHIIINLTHTRRTWCKSLGWKETSCAAKAYRKKSRDSTFVCSNPWQIKQKYIHINTSIKVI